MNTRRVRFSALCLLVCITVMSLKSLSGQGIAAAKTELYAIPVVTLSDQQFLSGRKDGKSDVIAGELRIPTRGTDRLPAVVIVHGSGGYTAQEEHWARALNDMGVATFVLDGFTGRGIAGTSADQSQLGTLTMINDAYRAFDLIAKHPRIDSTRVAVMGSSRGAKIAVAAAVRRFQKHWGTSGLEFVAHIGFYTPCAMRYLDDTDVVDRPIRLFHGEEDDFTPLQPCRAYVDDLRRRSKDVGLHVYAGAYHLFDNPGMPLGRNEESQTAKRCSWVERSTGQVVNATTGRPFTLDDPCVERGVTRGFNESAHTQADGDVRSLLIQIFGLRR